ncbi:MAG: hypothetical protein ACRDTP_07995 [Mycobacteriales bacterium]
MTLDDTAPTTTLTDGWKANFDDIYDQPDPRRYLAELGKLGYGIPHHGQQLFGALLAARPTAFAEPPVVLDLCCSYGINAALMTCDVSLDDLEQHYAACAELSPEDLVETDRSWYAEHRLADAPVVAGLDVSEQAVAYGEKVGLLQPGVVENLEVDPVSAGLAPVVAGADLITVTGGVGYITAATFAHLLEQTGDGPPPWVAAFILRQLSYHDIADVLAEHGLVTERLTGRTFPQRRFASESEQEFTLRHLGESGLGTDGLESDGLLHTEFYLSRPAAEVAATPLSALVPA